MTVAALKALLATLCDESDADIPLSLVLPWLNECSDDLAPVARKRVRATADFAGGGSFALPADLVELCEITHADTLLVPAAASGVGLGGISYSRWGGVIQFPETVAAGELSITYYRRLTALTVGADVPEIPLQFHRLYALWAAARYWQYRDAGDEPSKVLMQRNEYTALKAELDRHTRGEGTQQAFRRRWTW